MNCTTKVGGKLSIVTRLKTVFPRGHSSNFATGATIVSFSKVDLGGDSGLG